MNGKIILAGLVAFLLAFFGGWLIFGILMADFYSAHTTEAAKSIMRSEEEMSMLAIALATLSGAVLITWIVVRTASITFASAFKVSFILGLLMLLNFNLGQYAFYDMVDVTLIVVDVIAGAIFWGLIGGLVGWILGRGTNAPAAP